MSIRNDINTLVEVCHDQAFEAGWWDDALRDDKTFNCDPHIFPTKLCLIHSELSEAMEADRTGAMDQHLPHLYGREVELADAIIRIFDLAGFYCMDLGLAVAEKLAYNRQRADHKSDARKAIGGKRY